MGPHRHLDKQSLVRPTRHRAVAGHRPSSKGPGRAAARWADRCRARTVGRRVVAPAPVRLIPLVWPRPMRATTGPISVSVAVDRRSTIISDGSRTRPPGGALPPQPGTLPITPVRRAAADRPGRSTPTVRTTPPRPAAHPGRATVTPRTGRPDRLPVRPLAVVTERSTSSATPGRTPPAPATPTTTGQARVWRQAQAAYRGPAVLTTPVVTPGRAIAVAATAAKLDGPSGSPVIQRPPARPEPSAPAIDVARLTDQVVAAIDRRLVAHRERMGRR